MCPSTFITSTLAKWLFTRIAAFHMTMTVLLGNKCFWFLLTLLLASQRQPPTAILTRLFQLWDYSYQQAEEGLFVPVNCWFKDGQLNYMTSHSNSLGEDGPAHPLLTARFWWLIYQCLMLSSKESIRIHIVKMWSNLLVLYVWGCILNLGTKSLLVVVWNLMFVSQFDRIF